MQTINGGSCAFARQWWSFERVKLILLKSPQIELRAILDVGGGEKVARWWKWNLKLPRRTKNRIRRFASRSATIDLSAVSDEMESLLQTIARCACSWVMNCGAIVWSGLQAHAFLSNLKSIARALKLITKKWTWRLECPKTFQTGHFEKAVGQCRLVLSEMFRFLKQVCFRVDNTFFPWFSNRIRKDKADLN